MPKDIKSFRTRNVDIILFEKYPDANHRKQGKKLYDLFQNINKTIISMKYGNFTRNSLILLSSDSKFVIYFSFYDSESIALKEIKNYGVITFSFQRDLVVSDKTGYYIPELEIMM